MGTAAKVPVKGAILLTGIAGVYVGAPLPCLRWIHYRVYDTWLVRRQTYSYLPSHRALPMLLGRY